jgi:hypothetical protein
MSWVLNASHTMSRREKVLDHVCDRRLGKIWMIMSSVNSELSFSPLIVIIFLTSHAEVEKLEPPYLSRSLYSF